MDDFFSGDIGHAAGSGGKHNGEHPGRRRQPGDRHDPTGHLDVRRRAELDQDQIVLCRRTAASWEIIVQDLAIGSAGQGSYQLERGNLRRRYGGAGNGYSIKVRTMDNSVSGLSGSFTLSAKPGNSAAAGGIIAPDQRLPG